MSPAISKTDIFFFLQRVDITTTGYSVKKAGQLYNRDQNGNSEHKLFQGRGYYYWTVFVFLSNSLYSVIQLTFSFS